MREISSKIIEGSLVNSPAVSTRQPSKIPVRRFGQQKPQQVSCVQPSETFSNVIKGRPCFIPRPPSAPKPQSASGRRRPLPSLKRRPSFSVVGMPALTRPKALPSTVTAPVKTPMTANNRNLTAASAYKNKNFMPSKIPRPRLGAKTLAIHKHTRPQCVTQGSHGATITTTKTPVFAVEVPTECASKSDETLPVASLQSQTKTQSSTAIIKIARTDDKTEQDCDSLVISKPSIENMRPVVAPLRQEMLLTKPCIKFPSKLSAYNTPALFGKFLGARQISCSVIPKPCLDEMSYGIQAKTSHFNLKDVVVCSLTNDQKHISQKEACSDNEESDANQFGSATRPPDSCAIYPRDQPPHVEHAQPYLSAVPCSVIKSLEIRHEYDQKSDKSTNILHGKVRPLEKNMINKDEELERQLQDLKKELDNQTTMFASLESFTQRLQDAYQILETQKREQDSELEMAHQSTSFKTRELHKLRINMQRTRALDEDRYNELLSQYMTINNEKNSYVRSVVRLQAELIDAKKGQGVAMPTDNENGNIAEGTAGSSELASLHGKTSPQPSQPETLADAIRRIRRLEVCIEERNCQLQDFQKSVDSLKEKCQSLDNERVEEMSKAQGLLLENIQGEKRIREMQQRVQNQEETIDEMEKSLCDAVGKCQELLHERETTIELFEENEKKLLEVKNALRKQEARAFEIAKERDYLVSENTELRSTLDNLKYGVKNRSVKRQKIPAQKSQTRPSESAPRKTCCRTNTSDSRMEMKLKPKRVVRDKKGTSTMNATKVQANEATLVPEPVDSSGAYDNELVAYESGSFANVEEKLPVDGELHLTPRAATLLSRSRDDGDVPDGDVEVENLRQVLSDREGTRMSKVFRKPRDALGDTGTLLSPINEYAQDMTSIAPTDGHVCDEEIARGVHVGVVTSQEPMQQDEILSGSQIDDTLGDG